jgi:hypothetical protein
MPDTQHTPKEGTSFYLPIALASDLRKFCYDQRISMSEFATNALTPALKKAKIAADLKAKKVQR